MDIIPGTKRNRSNAGNKKPAYKHIYATAQWQKIRGIVLAQEPLCRLCGRNTQSIDHLDGDNRNQKRCNLQGLCTPCHGWKSNIFEKRIRLGSVTNYTEYVAGLEQIEYQSVFIRPQTYQSDPQFRQSFLATLCLAIRQDNIKLWHSAAVEEIQFYHADKCLDFYVFNGIQRISTSALLAYIEADCQKLSIEYASVLRYSLLITQYGVKYYDGI